ncbi:hypothetical protein G6O67_008668 [Ophiocordyceps sinensis]|uniref:Aspartate racemase n=2 Tax=Ophiocordyceps sinensis TaxID=72228 RepID=A0A8H4LQP3_9HYPO|nr:aspartate racemase [Ophiocordyceps sinensis CO18]KAF4504049.1 hypothetical protein G6O67_008668 [Ophiocordyceps sinensis]
MKTIGIIGGMGWPSSCAYYEKINSLISTQTGGSHGAKLALIQTDSEEILRLEEAGEWKRLGEIMVGLAEKLKSVEADFFLIACNTMHKSLLLLGDQRLPLPLIHIVDATAQKLTGYKKVGLLGSRVTMTEEYFVGRLTEQYGLEVLVPPPDEQTKVQAAVKELARAVFRDATREMFRGIIAGLVERGAEVVVLGCTEFGRLVREEDCPRPMVDTLVAHVEAAVRMASDEDCMS